MSESWKTIRQEVLDRDSSECQHCGDTENLEVHHLRQERDYTYENRANDTANLVTLCRSCHRQLEGMSVEEQRSRLVESGGADPQSDFIDGEIPEPDPSKGSGTTVGIRALLTDGQRKAIRGDDDVSDGSRSTQLSRTRKKIEQMEEDAAFLKEHRPEMYDQLRDAVASEDIERRFEQLENEVRDLREQVEADGA